MPEDEANIYENKCGLMIWGPRQSVTWRPCKGVMVSCVCVGVSTGRPSCAHCRGPPGPALLMPCLSKGHRPLTRWRQPRVLARVPVPPGHDTPFPPSVPSLLKEARAHR